MTESNSRSKSNWLKLSQFDQWHKSLNQVIVTSNESIQIRSLHSVSLSQWLTEWFDQNHIICVNQWIIDSQIPWFWIWFESLRVSHRLKLCQSQITRWLAHNQWVIFSSHWPLTEQWVSHSVSLSLTPVSLSLSQCHCQSQLAYSQSQIGSQHGSLKLSDWSTNLLSVSVILIVQ